MNFQLRIIQFNKHQLVFYFLNAISLFTISKPLNHIIFIYFFMKLFLNISCHSCFQKREFVYLIFSFENLLNSKLKLSYDLQQNTILKKNTCFFERLKYQMLYDYLTEALKNRIAKNKHFNLQSSSNKLCPLHG